MSNQDNSTADNHALARDELRKRCLSFVRRWQPLAQNGWDHRAARKLGEELDQIAETSDRLGLEQVNSSALELEAYLCSFIDDVLSPKPTDLERLAAMVNRLGAVLTDLSATATAQVHTLSRARTTAHPEGQQDAGMASNSYGVDVDRAATSANELQRHDTTAIPKIRANEVCLVGHAPAAIPGLASGLGERGYQIREFRDEEGLLGFVTHTVPGVILIDAARLRLMRRLTNLYAKLQLTSRNMPRAIAVSDNGDLAHRLLAMRSGVSAFFSLPVDSLHVVKRIDEFLGRGEQPGWRIMLVDRDREHAIACAHHLVERGMTARVSDCGRAALSILGDFRPDLILIDADLPDLRGIELIQLIRQQSEYAAVPIILAANDTDIGQRFDAIAAGGDDYLLKPVKTRHLLGAVQAHVQRAHWLREIVGSPGARDARTGLYSRTALIEKLETALGDRSAAVLYFALDHAVMLHEQIGLSGVAALDAHIGNLLRAELEELDLSAQYQDFHYFTLLHRRSRAEITAAAERVRVALSSQPWRYNNRSHQLTASIGMAMLGDSNASVDSVVTNAQAAGLAAAHMGGDRILWFEAQEAALLPADRTLAIRAILSRPLNAEQTRFEFGPIARLAGKLIAQFQLGMKIVSVQHQGSTISYAELAPIAQECGHIQAIDRLVMSHALDVRQQQLNQGRQLRLFVPQSIETALDQAFPAWLDHELKQRHLSGTGLTIQLGCSALIDAGDYGIERIKAMHRLGLRFCLLDYGRDWAAVHALKDLGVDFVQLAPNLASGLNTAKALHDTVLALVRKAHEAGTGVIAPEVDSLQRAHLLLRLGVDYGIGPAFAKSRAQPAYDFNKPLW